MKKFNTEVENFYVSFSDLLSLLLIFFVYLFSMSTIDPVKYTQTSESISEEFSKDQHSGKAAEGQNAGQGQAAGKASANEKTIGQTIDELIAKASSKDDQKKPGAGNPATGGKSQSVGQRDSEKFSQEERDAIAGGGESAAANKNQTLGQNDATKLSPDQRQSIAGGGEPAASEKSQTIGQTIDKFIAKVTPQDSMPKKEASAQGDHSNQKILPADRSAQGILADKLAYYIQKEKLDGQASVQVGPRGVKVVLEAPVLFASGSAELSPEGIRILKKLGPVFKEVTNPVVIEGHTDNIPVHNSVYGTNWELSFYRTLSVMKFFISGFGFTPNQLSGTGYGEYRPLVANNSNINRAKNRRIEITILRDYDAPESKSNAPSAPSIGPK
jgi:flagellar motor protein MotB